VWRCFEPNSKRVKCSNNLNPQNYSPLYGLWTCEKHAEECISREWCIGAFCSWFSTYLQREAITKVPVERSPKKYAEKVAAKLDARSTFIEEYAVWESGQRVQAIENCETRDHISWPLKHERNKAKIVWIS
jgi:hypothetical protein